MILSCFSTNEWPFVSVFLPVRNEEAYIEKTLLDVTNQDYPSDRYEILVADGMSTDKTSFIVKSLAEKTIQPAIRLIANSRMITSCGMNAAINVAVGEVILRMDAHTEYASDYIRSCLKVLKETGADNVGGPARTKSNGYIQRAVAAAYHSRFSAGGAKFHDPTYEGPIDTVTYGCWPRATFQRFGLFDEELVRNQDDEHNLRIVRGGGLVWQSMRIKSWYWPRSSMKSLFQQYSQYGYWKVRVIQKHRIPASIRHLVPASFLSAVILLLLLSLLWFPAFILLFILLSSYLFCSVIAAWLTAKSAGWDLFPLLPVVFSCYHFGYGYGFLCGVIDFCLLKKRPGQKWSLLTRK